MGVVVTHEVREEGKLFQEGYCRVERNTEWTSNAVVRVYSDMLRG